MKRILYSLPDERMRRRGTVLLSLVGSFVRSFALRQMLCCRRRTVGSLALSHSTTFLSWYTARRIKGRPDGWMEDSLRPVSRRPDWICARFLCAEGLMNCCPIHRDTRLIFQLFVRQRHPARNETDLLSLKARAERNIVIKSKGDCETLQRRHKKRQRGIDIE
jgi:hypothetical protein